jgi:hypothetical protein
MVQELQGKMTALIANKSSLSEQMEGQQKEKDN